MRRIPLSNLLLMVLASTAGAQSKTVSPDAARARLEQTEHDRAAAAAAQQAAAARAAAAAQQAARLTDARATALATLEQAERATEAVAARMQSLAVARQAAKSGLAERAEAMRPLLPLVERLSIYPSQTMLAVPLPPQQAIRGVLVLQGVAREIADQAAALRHQQDELTRATTALAAEAPKLAAAEAVQASAAAALDRELALASQARRAAAAEAAAAGRRAAALAAQAVSLRALIARLAQAQNRKAAGTEAPGSARRGHSARQQAAFAVPVGPASIPGHARPHGQLLVPVVGRVIRNWGDPTDAGPADGISYRAAPAARVVAPCSGKVLFAAPFRSYGRLLILDCGGGYDAVLAGFARLDVALGQTVRRGDPVGTLPDWHPAGGATPPSLYVELRHNGDAVDPGPWFGRAGHGLLD